MRKIVVIMLAMFMLVTTLTACSENVQETDQDPTKSVSQDTSNEVSDETSSEEADDLKFAYVTQDMANPYFVEVYNGFVKGCEELGIEVSVYDAKYDVATQVTYLEDCIEQAINGVMITPLDENALATLVDQAKEQGIVIGAEAQAISNAQIDGSLDEYTYGVHIGMSAVDWINEKLDGKGNVLIVAQDDVEAVIARSDGIQDTITEQCPDTVIVARQNGSNTELAMSVTENILTAHPEVNVICTCDDFGGIGAYQAVKGMGMGSDTFGIFAADATEEGVAKMKEEGSVYRSSVSIFPYDCGYEMAYAMYNYIMDGKNADNAEAVVVERKYEPVLQSDVVDN